MTVQEVIDRLHTFPPEMEVNAMWDDCVWPLHRIEHYKGEYEGAEELALIDCSSCGDWEYFAEHNQTEMK